MRTGMHDAIVRSWSRMLFSGKGAATSVEYVAFKDRINKALRAMNDNRKGDLYANLAAGTEAGGEKDICLDIMCMEALSPSQRYLATEEGSLAAKGESLKVAKYAGRLAAGEFDEFVPLVITTTGELGPAAEKFIKSDINFHVRALTTKHETSSITI